MCASLIIINRKRKDTENVLVHVVVAVHVVVYVAVHVVVVVLSQQGRPSGLSDPVQKEHRVYTKVE